MDCNVCQCIVSNPVLCIDVNVVVVVVVVVIVCVTYVVVLWAALFFCLPLFS